MAIKNISLDLCNGCGRCVKACAVDVIRIDKEKKKAVIKYPDECMLCEMCIRECPKGAIEFDAEKTSSLLLSWG